MTWRPDRRLRSRMARALRARGDRRRAEPALESALRWYLASLWAAPDRTGTLRRVAETAILCGERARGERAWRRLAERDPDRPEPAARLARLAAEAGRLDEAACLARRSLERDASDTSRLSRATRMRSLLAHLERGAPGEPGHRHVALCGVSYCGSTLVSYFLGSLPGVANVGESHWLVDVPDRTAGGFAPRSVDLADVAPEELPLCGACVSPDCPVLSLALRRSLSRDPVDWYERIAGAQGEPVLVSSDKNHGVLLSLDPWLRFDAVVLFRSPLHAWSSARAKARNRQGVRDYLETWDREYRSFVFDLPNRGRKLFVDFEVLRRDLPRHLERLCRALSLPFDARFVDDVDRGQHAIGGNVRVHRALEGAAPVSVVPADPVELPAHERELVARFERSSRVLALLRAGHRQVFGDPR